MSAQLPDLLQSSTGPTTKGNAAVFPQPVRSSPATCKLVIKVFRNEIISETVESTPDSTLRSLRIFILKTFPFLPTRFLFVQSTGELIDIKLEKSCTVSFLNGLVYIKPYIPLPETRSSVVKSKVDAARVKDRLRKKQRGAQSIIMPTISRTQSAHPQISRSNGIQKQEHQQMSQMQRPLTADNSIMSSSKQVHTLTELSTERETKDYYDDFEEEVEDFSFRMSLAKGDGADVSAGRTVSWVDINIGPLQTDEEIKKTAAITGQVLRLRLQDPEKLRTTEQPSQPDEATRLNSYLNIANIAPNELNMTDYRLYNGVSSVVTSFNESSEFQRYFYIQMRYRYIPGLRNLFLLLADLYFSRLYVNTLFEV